MNKKNFFLYFLPIGLFVSFIILGLIYPYLFISSKSVDNFFYYGDKINFLSSFDPTIVLFVLLFAVFTAFFYILLVFKPRSGIILGFLLWGFSFIVSVIWGGAFELISFSSIYFGFSVGVILFLSKIYNSANYYYKKIIIIIPLCALGLLAIFVLAISPLILSKIAKTMNNSTLCEISATKENVSLCYDALGIETKDPSLCRVNYDLDASGEGKNCFNVAKALEFENVEDLKKDHMKSLYNENLASRGKTGKRYTAYVPRNKEEYFLYMDKFYVDGVNNTGNIIVGDDERDDFIYCYDATFGIPDDTIKCMRSIKVFDNTYHFDTAVELPILNAKIEIFNRHHSK